MHETSEDDWRHDFLRWTFRGLRLMTLLILSVVSIALLGGCSMKLPQLLPQETPVMPTLPRPEPVVMLPVEFRVKDGLICMTGDNYENLALNMADILRFVRQQNTLITRYEEQR